MSNQWNFCVREGQGPHRRAVPCPYYALPFAPVNLSITCLFTPPIEMKHWKVLQAWRETSPHACYTHLLRMVIPCFVLTKHQKYMEEGWFGSV
ncbi:hypothetical protein CEXT_379301 [Caerostris extrusa]|uniref:Uncharacterized protein n=1 Tax=Caerostris extrusa TaxID=172846 RepID=A0AAV4NLT1_CAEEX|nr:hypothetical protein CEXT_379301 [Caerostris extrusa]